MCAVLLAAACAEERPAESADAGSVSLTDFQSTLLSRTRSVAELDPAEQRFLCNEGLVFLNGAFTAEEWAQHTCFDSVARREATPEACEARLQECEETGEYDGYDLTYSERCTFRTRLGCSLSVHDIEQCFNEIAADTLRYDRERRMCALVGMSLPDFISGLSPGCRIAYEETDCQCVLIAPSGDGDIRCP